MVKTDLQTGDIVALNANQAGGCNSILHDTLNTVGGTQ